MTAKKYWRSPSYRVAPLSRVDLAKWFGDPPSIPSTFGEATFLVITSSWNWASVANPLSRDQPVIFPCWIFPHYFIVDVELNNVLSLCDLDWTPSENPSLSLSSYSLTWNGWRFYEFIPIHRVWALPVLKSLRSMSFYEFLAFVDLILSISIDEQMNVQICLQFSFTFAWH